MGRIWQLATLTFAAGIGSPRAEDDKGEFGWSEAEPDLSCFVHGDHVSVQPIDDGYSVSNATFSREGKDVVNLVLEDQEAQFELPGMVLRVSTETYRPPTSLDDPFANIDELKQGLWSTIGGNLLGMFLLTFSVCLVIYLERRYQCVGGEQIHAMVEQHHRLQADLNKAVQFLREMDGEQAQQLDEEDIIMSAGKTVAAKAVDGAMVSTVGSTKAAALKKGAEKVAETDQYAEAKVKAMEKAEAQPNGARLKKKKKQQPNADPDLKFTNPMNADSDDAGDIDQCIA